MPPRPRKPDHRSLESYPGLHRYPDGRYYIRHPITGKSASLKTRKREEAIALWRELTRMWAQDISDVRQTALVDRLASLSRVSGDPRHLTVAEYLRQWREERVGYIRLSTGAIDRQPTRLRAIRGRNKGAPIDPVTQTDFGQACLQLEERNELRVPLSHPQLVAALRAAILPWLDKPRRYNGLRATLIRALDDAVAGGLILRNPARDINKAIQPQRDVYITDEDYLLITNQLVSHKIKNTIHNGEWRVRICDFLYMFSQQPGDTFALREAQIHLEIGPEGEIHFERSKTAVSGVIEMNAELRETVEWLIAFKRSTGATCPELLVAPNYMSYNVRMRPVNPKTFARWFSKAVADAGLAHKGYHLHDLRTKALTDEALVAGAPTDKGAHDSEAMKKYYVRLAPPKRARNTLGVKR